MTATHDRKLPYFRTSIVLAGVLSSTVATAGSLKDLDKRAGFRDVSFEQSCNEIEGLKGNTGAVKAAVKAGMGAEAATSVYKGMLQYTRAADVLEVGAAELLGIHYTCYMEQLMAVQVSAFGQRNSLPLRDALIEAYGDPTSGDEDTGRWAWEGKKVVLTVVRDPLTRMTTATWASVKMLDLKAKNDVADKKSAIQDL